MVPCLRSLFLKSTIVTMKKKDHLSKWKKKLVDFLTHMNFFNLAKQYTEKTS